MYYLHSNRSIAQRIRKTVGMASSNIINIIAVPADTASIIRGKHLAPEALLNAGLASKLQLAGYEVSTINALPNGPRVWEPSSTEPNGARNEAVNVEVYHRVKETVSAALTPYSSDKSPFQLILGGGCDITPAILSSYWQHIGAHERVGLVYIDADTDLVKPGQPGSVGTLASMTMTHLTMNEGALESMRAFTRPDGQGVVNNENVILFGLNLGAAGNTKEHLGYLLDENFQVFTSAAVAKEPERRAKQALDWMEKRVDHIIVHLDVDSIDASLYPLANVPNFTGAAFEAIMKALEVFLGSEKAAALVIAEVNPDHDPGAKMTERLVDEVTGYLASRRRS